MSEINLYEEPTIVTYRLEDDDGGYCNVTKFYNKLGDLHRITGPAVIKVKVGEDTWDDDGQFLNKIKFKFYIDGKQIKKKNFEQKSKEYLENVKNS